MSGSDLPNIDPNVDYKTILPIHQKRTIAFINNFIMNTVSFLNHFAQSCESRLMDFEYKIQKLKASLLILESQLASIPGIEEHSPCGNDEQPNTVDKNESQQTVNLPDVAAMEAAAQSSSSKPTQQIAGVPASSDPRFAKYFKMVYVGVPVEAVKNKMTAEGLNPSILDKPNEIVPSSGELGDTPPK